MKIHRFIVDEDFGAERFVLQDREATRQMRNVLKLKKGEFVLLGNGRLEEALCRISDIGGAGIELEVVKRDQNANEPFIKTVLYCAILKRENFDLVVQKATEVGVTEIQPVISQRTVKLDINMERVMKIAKEAAEQSGRGVVPIIHEPVKFSEALKSATANAANYFFEQGAPPFDKGVLKMKGMNRVGIFIGTEGGWDEAELDEARLSAFHLVSMGALTFRAETAAIIATYLITTPIF